MKIAVLIARILLGLLFVFAGLNGFLNFVPAPPLPGGLVGEFVDALVKSHYVLAVSAVQLVGGILLLVNRYVPLALTLLGPVIVNILLFHLLLNHTGLVMAFVVAILWCIIAYRYRDNFAGLFVQKAA
jgi:putative oxidoreductase